jgi:hypothetical protein
LEIHLKIQKQEKESLLKRFHLTNKEHQKLFNENIVINEMVHKQKNQKIRKIQNFEKQKYKKLLKKKKEKFKEEIQEKLRKTGIFLPGFNKKEHAESIIKTHTVNNTPKAELQNQQNPKKVIPATNHMISEIVTSRNQMNQLSGFYVNYHSSDDQSEYIVSGESIDDEQITERLKDMQNERKIKENVDLHDDLDQISLDMIDPKNFTLGKNDNQLKDLTQGLSYVHQDEAKTNKLRKRTERDVGNWKKKKQKSGDELRLSGGNKKWSRADSFSADSEEGIE